MFSSLLPPCHDINKICLPFLTLLHIAAVARYAEAAHTMPLRGGAQLWISDKPAHDRYNVEHFK